MSNLVDRVDTRKLRQERASFGSKKLGWINVIAADIRLKPVEKLVGIVVIQHLSMKTLKAWPGIERIGIKGGGISAPTVKRAIKRLCETGWLVRRRAPKKGAYNSDGWG